VIGVGDHLQPRARDAVGEASGDDADLRMVVIADDDQRRYLDPVWAADIVLVGEQRMPLLGDGPGLGALPRHGLGDVETRSPVSQVRPDRELQLGDAAAVRTAMRRDVDVHLRARGHSCPSADAAISVSGRTRSGCSKAESSATSPPMAQADQTRRLEAESVQDRQQVVLIAERRGRWRRASQTPGVIPDHGVVPCQLGEHAVPQAAVVDRSMKRDERRAVPGPLGPDVAPAGDGDQLSRHAPDSITPPRSTAHPPTAEPTRRSEPHNPARTLKAERSCNVG
jgi:hypothetical protein